MCLCILCVCVCACACVCELYVKQQRIDIQYNRHMELTVVAVWNANLLPVSLA